MELEAAGSIGHEVLFGPKCMPAHAPVLSALVLVVAHGYSALCSGLRSHQHVNSAHDARHGSASVPVTGCVCVPSHGTKDWAHR